MRENDPVLLGPRWIDGRWCSVWSDGTVLPVVRGGDGEGGAAGDPPGGAGGGAGGGQGGGAGGGAGGQPDLAALQAEIDRAKASGTSEATAGLLKTLGFEKVEDVQSFVTAKREEERSKMSEADRKAAEADDAKREADQEKATAATERLNTRIERALVRAGVGVGETDESKLDRLVDRARGALGQLPSDADDAAIKAKVDELKADMPALFGKAGTGGTPPAPSGVPGSGGPGGTPPPQGAGSSLEAGKAKARERFKVVDPNTKSA